MVEQAEEVTGVRVPTTLADAGYSASRHLEECARRGQQVVVPEARQQFFVGDPYHKDQFTHNESSDTYTCPQGQTLHFAKWQFVNRVWNRIYGISGAVCRR